MGQENSKLINQQGQRTRTKSGIDLNVCAYCSDPIDEYSRTTDHLYPKSRGGILSNKNKVPACGECNKLKGNMTVVEFERALTSMIFREHQKHKKEISRLKKIKKNTLNIIDDLNGKDKNNIVRSSSTGSRPDSKKKKKRP